MLVVQKYGGTSVGTVERIREVAERCIATQRAGHDVVVIVSAMSGETNRLLELAKQVNDEPPPEYERELDVIAATGEQVSVGLVVARDPEGGRRGAVVPRLAGAHRHRPAFTRARIQSIDGAEDPRRARSRARSPSSPAFRASTTTATSPRSAAAARTPRGVAIAAALKADVCEIYTDVDGVYTTDPNICPNARKIERISYEEMLELASLGAKVLQIRSVEFGMKYGVQIHVRSSFNQNEGHVGRSRGEADGSSAGRPA